MLAKSAYAIKWLSMFSTAFIVTAGLTACDKKDANANAKPATTSQASTTVTTASTTANTITAASNMTASSSTKSIVTQPITAGSPEETVKKAFDAMMHGTAKEASSYYQVDIPDFEKVLTEQQPILQQQLTHLELDRTKYNKDNTKAFITGKLTTKQSPTPQTVSYKLIKVNEQWKLVE